MTKRLKRNLNLLKVLGGAEPKLRRSILTTCPNDLIKCLCDCCCNILAGKIKLSRKHKGVLCKHRKVIRQLTSKKVTLPHKRQLLVKQSGGLPVAILAPILGVALSLLADRVLPR